MTANSKSSAPVHPASMTRRMLQGAAIALVPITLLLLSVDEPNPAWPKYWMVRPLIIVPIAGAMGGLFYYFMDHLRYEGGWKKVLAILLSVIVYFIILWMGTILGLDGTLWD